MAATASSDALLATADQLLDCAGMLSGDDYHDLVVTLATLAGLDPALSAYLETRTTGPSNASALARAALARYRSMPRTPATFGAGSGWRTPPVNMGAQSEAVPKR